MQCQSVSQRVRGQFLKLFGDACAFRCGGGGADEVNDRIDSGGIDVFHYNEEGPKELLMLMHE